MSAGFAALLQDSGSLGNATSLYLWFCSFIFNVAIRRILIDDKNIKICCLTFGLYSNMAVDDL